MEGEVLSLCSELEVDAQAHRQDEGHSDDEKRAELISGYEATMLKLLEQMKSIQELLKDYHKDDRKCTLQRLAPVLLVQVPAHCARHYWTSAPSRRAAQAVVASLVLSCGCHSIMELLCGEDMPDLPPSSPYLTARPEEQHADSAHSETLPQQTELPTTCDPKTVFNEPSEFEALSKGDNEAMNYEGNVSSRMLEAVSDEGSSTERLTVCMVEGGSQPEREVVFKSGLLKPVLSILKAKLTRDQWKEYPVAKHALIWCLRHLKHPHVGPRLDLFLPPLLMLLDDYEVYHKVLGLSGMTHLIKNVDPTELRWYGRADVIYEAIKKFLYINDPDIITALHPCMLALLPIVEGTPALVQPGPRKPSKSDEVFAIFLNSFDFESKISVRKAYIAHVNGYITLLRIYMVRHLKRLLSVLFACMEFPDYCGEETRQFALTSMAALMRYTWPRIPHHQESILKALLKLVADLCPSESCIPAELAVQKQLPLITHCLVVLARCCGEVKSYYDVLLSDCKHAGLSLCLGESLKELVIQATTTTIPTD